MTDSRLSLFVRHLPRFLAGVYVFAPLTLRVLIFGHIEPGQSPKTRGFQLSIDIRQSKGTKEFGCAYSVLKPNLALVFWELEREPGDQLFLLRI